MVIDQLHALGMNVEDPYETSKMKFLQGKEEGIMSTLIISGVMIFISLIESILSILYPIASNPISWLANFIL